MAEKQLRLLADSYDQRQPDSDGEFNEKGRLVPISKDELFMPVSDEEYDRLVESGAAIDPGEQAKREREAAEARIAQIKAEQAELEDRLAEASAGELEDQTVDELKAKASDLGIEGVSSMKKAELVEAIRSAG